MLKKNFQQACFVHMKGCVCVCVCVCVCMSEYVHASIFDWECKHNRTHMYEEQIAPFIVFLLLNGDDTDEIGMCGVQIGLFGRPRCISIYRLICPSLGSLNTKQKWQL